MAYIPLSQARQNLGLTDNSSTSSGGYTSLDQARTQLFNENQTKPKVTQTKISPTKPVEVKQIKAPPGGFKIGDFINKTVNNLVTKLANGLEVTLTKPATSPIPKQDIVKTGIPHINNFEVGQKQLTSQQLQKIKPDFSTQQGSSAKTTTTSKSLKQQKQVLDTIDSIKKALPQTTQALKEINKDPLSLKSDIKKLPLNVWNAVKDPINEYLKTKKDILTKPPKSLSEDIGRNLHLLSSGANVVLTPITALFALADNVPVLGGLSKALTLPFIVSGEGATKVSNKIVDTLPLSKTDKKNLKEPLGEIFALATQLILGKAVDLSIKTKGLTDKYGREDANTIIEQAKKLAEQKQPSLPEGEHPPQTVIDHVINNNLINTPDGKQLLKTAIEAQKQEMNVKVEKPIEKVENQPQTTKPITDEELITQYRSEFKGLLNTDNVREVYKPQGYNRINSAEFHDRASKLSEKIFNEDLETLKPKDKYLFTAGASGSGKSSSLLKFPDITSEVKAGLDGNFSSDSALKKLDKVVATGAKPEIIFFYREALDAWNNGVVKRAINPENRRVVPLNIFLDNLVNSQKKVLEAYEKYGDKIDIQVIDNSHGAGNARLIDNPIEFLKKISYNIDDVKQEILRSTKEKIKAGKIDEETGKALLSEKTLEKPQQERQNENKTTLKPSKIGKSIEAKAIEAKLTKEFSETAGFTPIKIKEQAERATKIVNEDLDLARAIVRGEEPLPEGLKGTALIKGMEEYIKKNPSEDLAYELANSPLVSKTSEAAQELRLAAEREPNSATAKLMEVKQAREAKTPEKAKQNLKKQVKKNNLSKADQSWDKFLNSIKC